MASYRQKTTSLKRPTSIPVPGSVTQHNKPRRHRHGVIVSTLHNSNSNNVATSAQAIDNPISGRTNYKQSDDAEDDLFCPVARSTAQLAVSKHPWNNRLQRCDSNGSSSSENGDPKPLSIVHEQVTRVSAPHLRSERYSPTSATKYDSSIIKSQNAFTTISLSETTPTELSSSLSNHVNTTNRLQYTNSCQMSTETMPNLPYNKDGNNIPSAKTVIIDGKISESSSNKLSKCNSGHNYKIYGTQSIGKPTASTALGGLICDDDGFDEMDLDTMSPAESKNSGIDDCSGFLKPDTGQSQDLPFHTNITEIQLDDHSPGYDNDYIISCYDENIVTEKTYAAHNRSKSDSRCNYNNVPIQTSLESNEDDDDNSFGAFISSNTSKTVSNILNENATLTDTTNTRIPTSMLENKRASIVDGLLHEIYDRFHLPGRADSFDSDTLTECSSTSDAAFFHHGGPGSAGYHGALLERRHASGLNRSFLQSQSRAQLKRMLMDLERSSAVMNARLVKQLKRRDRRLAKLQRNCDIVTAVLQAASLKRQIDTRMKFSIQPPRGGSAFDQWRDAMKAVCRLPMGIPTEFRKKVWLSLAEHYLFQLKINWEKTVRLVFNERSNPDDEQLGLQIVKDLHRTGCSNFSGEENDEDRAILKRLLLAYARWNKRVGYCQGFNVIAALLLNVMDRREDDALKVMIYLIDSVLPESYFANNLRALSVDMAVFRDLLRNTYPRLSNHLDKLQLAGQDIRTGACYEPPLPNVFTMQWFLTLFATCLPLTTVLRVWDSILLEGSEILLRTALTIWGKLAKRVMKASSADEFYCLMGELTSSIMQGTILEGDAMIKSIYALGEFPFTQLNELREKYTYNIRPFNPSGSGSATQGKSSARSSLRSLLQLRTSDEDELDDDDITVMACMPGNVNGSADDISVLGPGVYGEGRGAGASDDQSGASSSDPPAMERMSTDIQSLKMQYQKLKQRQQQAHVIIAAASAKKARPVSQHEHHRVEKHLVSTPTPPRLLVANIESPTAMNHLFVGKPAGTSGAAKNRLVTDGPRISGPGPWQRPGGGRLSTQLQAVARAQAVSKSRRMKTGISLVGASIDKNSEDDDNDERALASKSDTEISSSLRKESTSKTDIETVISTDGNVTASCVGDDGLVHDKDDIDHLSSQYETIVSTDNSVIEKKVESYRTNCASITEVNVTGCDENSKTSPPISDNKLESCGIQTLDDRVTESDIEHPTEKVDNEMCCSPPLVLSSENAVSSSSLDLDAQSKNIPRNDAAVCMDINQITSAVEQKIQERNAVPQVAKDEIAETRLSIGCTTGVKDQDEQLTLMTNEMSLQEKQDNSNCSVDSDVKGIDKNIDCFPVEKQSITSRHEEHDQDNSVNELNMLETFTHYNIGDIQKVGSLSFSTINEDSGVDTSPAFSPFVSDDTAKKPSLVFNTNYSNMSFLDEEMVLRVESEALEGNTDTNKDEDISDRSCTNMQNIRVTLTMGATGATAFEHRGTYNTTPEANCSKPIEKSCADSVDTNPSSSTNMTTHLVDDNKDSQATTNNSVSSQQSSSDDSKPTYENPTTSPRTSKSISVCSTDNINILLEEVTKPSPVRKHGYIRVRSTSVVDTIPVTETIDFDPGQYPSTENKSNSINTQFPRDNKTNKLSTHNKSDEANSKAKNRGALTRSETTTATGTCKGYKNKTSRRFSSFTPSIASNSEALPVPLASSSRRLSQPFNPFPVKHFNSNRMKAGLKLGLYTPSTLEQLTGIKSRTTFS